MTDKEAELVEVLEDLRSRLADERDSMLKEMVKNLTGLEDWLKATREFFVDERDREMILEDGDIIENAALSLLKERFNPEFDIVSEEYISERYSMLQKVSHHVNTILSVTGDNESYMFGTHHEAFSLEDKESIRVLSSDLEKIGLTEEYSLSDERLEDLDKTLDEFITSNIVN